MEDNQVSLTSIMTAYIRAYHSRFDNPKVFDDFLAYPFLPDERRRAIELGITEMLQLTPTDFSTLTPNQRASVSSILQAMGASNVLSRSRYAEDTLKHKISEGISQYILLGAGMDTFALRCPELLEQLLVFELDHPATQAFKRNRLAELGWQLPPRLHFVPVDFTRDSLGAVLNQLPYDPQAKSLFSWLGVTMYLTQEQVFALLADIARNSAAGSMVIFDYHDTDFPGQGVSATQTSGAAQAGESMQAVLDPSTLAQDLARIGLQLQENLNPTAINERYFEGRSNGYKATANTYLACAKVN